MKTVESQSNAKQHELTLHIPIDLISSISTKYLQWITSNYEQVKQVQESEQNLGFISERRWKQSWIERRRERKVTTMSLKRLASLGGRVAPIVVVGGAG